MVSEALPPGLLAGLLVALGGGLLIGIERERRKGATAHRALAGVRTFTLASVCGALAQGLGQPWLVVAGAMLVLALVAIGYWRDRSRDPGVTTEIALFVTYLLGVAAISQPALAAAGAVVVAALLAARNRLHRFATEVLTAGEMRDALILAGAALVLLPLLPDRPQAWLGGLDPQRVWALAVLIMALQGAGYIAQRWMGAHRGLALASLASGFASSTAVIGALGLKLRGGHGNLEASVAAALYSSMATFIQSAILAAAVHWPALAFLGPSLVAGLAATALAGSVFFLRTHDGGKLASREGRAFSPWQAIGFALALAVLGALAGFVNERYGSGAVQAGAALAGFGDAHAAGASALALVADGRLDTAAAVMACLLAISTNTASKIAVAFATGGARYGLRVGAGLLLALAAMWAGQAWPGNGAM
ncbi:MAG: MgtC/SapB family protein [Betaproteobacteria bacterium]